MKIYRCGAKRNHGWDALVDTPHSEVSVDQHNAEVVMRVSDVAGKSEATSHHWEVHLTLNEIASVITLLSETIFDEHTDELCDALKNSSKDLQNLQICAAGFPPPRKLKKLLAEAEKRKATEALAARRARRH